MLKQAIDPKSVAGILLREHDTPQQAFDYASRKATFLAGLHNATGLDYAEAARQIAIHYTLPAYSLCA
jgi:hypothetical protein